MAEAMAEPERWRAAELMLAGFDRLVGRYVVITSGNGGFDSVGGAGVALGFRFDDGGVVLDVDWGVSFAITPDTQIVVTRTVPEGERRQVERRRE